MAHSLNAKLGPLLYASNEVQASLIQPMARAMAVSAKADQVQPLAINPQQIEKIATVHAVFAIE